MPIPPLTRDQVRRVDQVAIREYGMSGLVLMENAGHAAATLIHDHSLPGQIAILCGKGNNGGDGYVIARHLELFGRDVKVFSAVPLDQLRGDAESNASIAVRSGISIHVVGDAARPFVAHVPAAVVDCLLGTGATGPPRGVYADLVAAANSTDSLRFAIDIPTGLDCDTGVASDPTFLADHTITFVAAKVGFLLGNAADYLGSVHEVGIGVPAKLLLEFH